jgi:hypothetical protein
MHRPVCRGASAATRRHVSVIAPRWYSRENDVVWTVGARLTGSPLDPTKGAAVRAFTVAPEIRQLLGLHLMPCTVGLS